MKFTVVLTAFIVTYPFTLIAAEEDTDNEDNTIIVTASRSAQTVDDALASVSVITADDIADSQALSVKEVLEGIAGIDIVNNGGYGKTTSVFMRGTESYHTAVLIDGVRIGSATLGGAPWADLPLSQIERIEVVRGARSSLYGSDAIGGVIQIFTKKDRGNRSQATLGGGNNRTVRMAANVSSKNGIAWHTINMERFTTKGIDARQPTTGMFAVDEPDNDAYVRNSFSARGGFRADNNTEFDLNAQYNDGNSEFDSTTNNTTDFVQQLINARIAFNITPSSRLIINGGQTRDESFNFRADGSSIATEFNNLRDQYSFQGDIDFGKAGLIITGVDYYNDAVESTTDYAETTRYNSGAFVQYSNSLRMAGIQAGVRVDNNEQFGNHTTGNLAISGKFKPITVIASYGTAFRAPSFNELYFPFYGNPDMKPEQSRSAELSIRGKHKWVNWELTGFRNEIDNLVAYDSSILLANNIDEARIDGAELRFNVGLNGMAIGADYTALDPRDVETDNILPRRSRQTGKLDISYSGNSGKIGLAYARHGRRYDDKANTIQLDAYAVTNIYTKLQLSGNWSIRAKIDNLMNKEYQTTDTYNQTGRTAFLSLHYE